VLPGGGLSTRIVVISDTQLPYEDRKAVKAVIRAVGDIQPDEVIQIGDLVDFPQPSRWSKGTAAEFEGSVYKDCEYAKRSFLEPLRAVFDGPLKVHEGNHDERARVYLAKYAPALSGTDAYNMENLLDFNGFGVELLPEFHQVAPGWITTHGHRGGIRLSQVGGQTALNAAKKFGKSVVMGHTHRLGIGYHTLGVGGQVSQTLTGVEVGNLMDMRKAGYLKGGTGQWQQGFAVLTVDTTHVHADTIPITQGKFIVDGYTWKV